MGYDTGMVMIDAQRCASMAIFIEQFVVDDIVGEYAVTGFAQIELWRESLRDELQELVNCYRFAARMEHPVLTGLS